MKENVTKRSELNKLIEEYICAVEKKGGRLQMVLE